MQNEPFKALSSAECEDINGGFMIPLPILVAVAFAVGVYNGYNRTMDR